MKTKRDTNQSIHQSTPQSLSRVTASENSAAHPTPPLPAAHTITAMEARKRFGQILEETFYRGDTFIIERSGRPMAVLVPIAAFARLEVEDALADPTTGTD